MSDKQQELIAVEVKGEIAQPYTANDLLQLAVDKNLDTDKLEKLIELKNKEEERMCKKDFDFHFAEMQKDYISANKSKNVMSKDGSKVLYKYCPLEDILKAYSPIIAKHGFSFSWNEVNNEKTKTVTCIVSGYGHQKESSVVIPIQEGNAFTNSIQQQGVSTTYGKRYSFINAFGVIIEEEDSDGDYESGIEYANQIKSLRACNNLEALTSMWIDNIYKDLQTRRDRDGAKVLKAEYERLKSNFQK